MLCGKAGVLKWKKRTPTLRPHVWVCLFFFTCTVVIRVCVCGCVAHFFPSFDISSALFFFLLWMLDIAELQPPLPHRTHKNEVEI